ncbi:MAG TPA: hypothetical protein VIK14_02700 [Ignavibacteria bacterium]
MKEKDMDPENISKVKKSGRNDTAMQKPGILTTFSRPDYSYNI